MIAMSYVLTVILLHRKFLRKKSLEYHGLWLIFLLLFPQLVDTSLTIVNCPKLMDSNGSIQTVRLSSYSVTCRIL